MTVPVAPGAPADAPPAVPVTTSPTPPAEVPATPAPPVPTPPQSSDDLAKLRADLDAANQRADQAKADSRKHEDRWKSRDDQIEQQSAILKLIAEKTGIVIDGKPDPAKLEQQLTASQQSARQARTENAVILAALGSGADATRLLDSRTFMLKTDGLDPSAADFGDRVKALVAESVAANPTLAVTAPASAAAPATESAPPALPAASGSDFSGAPSTAQRWTDEDVARATPAQLTKAIADGQLAHMGIAPPKKGRRG